MDVTAGANCLVLTINFETLNPVLARQRSKLALSKQALADL